MKDFAELVISTVDLLNVEAKHLTRDLVQKKSALALIGLGSFSTLCALGFGYWALFAWVAESHGHVAAGLTASMVSLVLGGGMLWAAKRLIE